MSTKFRFKRRLVICALFGIAAIEAFWIAQNRKEIERRESKAANRRTAMRRTPALPASNPPLSSNTHGSPSPESPRGSMRDWRDDFRERAIRSEAFQANLVKVMDGHLSRRYDELFRRLRLDPAQEGELRILLTQGLYSPELVPSDDTRKQANLEEAQEYHEEFEQRIRSLLGEENYRRYRGYMEELPALNTRNDIAATLAGSGMPLSPQAYAMLQTKLKSVPPKSRTESFASVDAVRTAITGSERMPMTEDLLAAAKDWLTPAQHHAVAVMYHQERAIRQAQELKDSLQLPLQLPEFGTIR